MVEILSSMGDPIKEMVFYCLSERHAGFRYILERGRTWHIHHECQSPLDWDELLHHIAAWILVPKIGKFDFITKREPMLMTSLVQSIAVNSPGIMAHLMQEAATSRWFCLPYSMGLTRVFWAFSNSLEGEAFKKILHMTLMMTSPFTRWDTERLEVDGFIKDQDRR